MKSVYDRPDYDTNATNKTSPPPPPPPMRFFHIFDR